jgi:hypothetical protein
MTTHARPIRGRANVRRRQRAWADRLGTAGWAAKGVVYLLIALLAGQLAFSGEADSDQTSKQGALAKLAEQPAGKFMLTIVVIGLFAYALYQLLSIFLPATGNDGKAWLQHLVRGGSAVVYGVLAFQGIGVLMDNAGRGSGGGSEAETKSWSATLLSSTPGTFVLVAIGIGFIGFGIHQIYRAHTRKFMRKLECRGRPGRDTIETVGVVGLSARAVVAGLLGFFVLLAVWKHNPDEVRGLDGALRTVQQAPAGPWILMAVAIGLAAYGVFALISARCRRHEAG